MGTAMGGKKRKSGPKQKIKKQKETLPKTTTDEPQQQLIDSQLAGL